MGAADAPTVEWLASLDRFESLAGEWRALEAGVHQRTHLSTFDFLASWYGPYAGPYGGAPLIGLARRGSRLVGVAPLVVRPGRIGRIPVTRVELAPSDVPAGEFLVEDDHPETIAAFVESLVAREKFDLASFDGFDPASPRFEALRQAADACGLAMEVDDHAFAVADLREGYAKYRAGLSGQHRRKLNQKARWIAEAGGAAVSGVEPSKDPAPGWQPDEALLRESVRRAIAVTEASYKLQGRRLADSHREFTWEVASRFGRRNMLSLSILAIGGQDAAFLMGVVDRGTFYDIALAYAEPFARLSPGVALMQQTLERLAAIGVHTVVSHGAHEYKRHWATAFVPQTRVFLFRPSLRGVLSRHIRFSLAPLWRRLRGGTGAGSGERSTDHATPDSVFNSR